MSWGVALAAAATISTVAAALRWLTPLAMLAATMVGTAVLHGSGWGGGAMLVVFFVSGSLLSRVSEARAGARAGDPKAGPRDAAQVLANGAIAAAGALLAGRLGVDPAVVAGGALAAAAADTWATEVGAFAARSPRLITTGQPVPRGTSGGITMLGTAASLGGATTVALVALPFGLQPAAAVAVSVAGWSGALLDSVVGAILQGRFRCDRCNVETERTTHRCGGPARHVGGVRWITNDVVNVVATGWGAAAAWLALAWR